MVAERRSPEVAFFDPQPRPGIPAARLHEGRKPACENRCAISVRLILGLDLSYILPVNNAPQPFRLTPHSWRLQLTIQPRQ